MIMQMSQKVVGNVELQNIVVKRVTRYNIVLNEYLPGKSKNVTEPLVNFIHAKKPKIVSNIKTSKIISLYQQENKSMLNIT